MLLMFKINLDIFSTNGNSEKKRKERFCSEQHSCLRFSYLLEGLQVVFPWSPSVPVSLPLLPRNHR